MSFLGSIVSAIGSALGFIGNAGSAVGSAVGSALTDVTSTVGSIATDVTSALKSAVTSAVDALGASATDVFKTVSDVLGSAVKVETEVLGAIQKYVDEASNFVNNINNEVVKPLTDTVSQTYDAVTNLVTELHTDIHGGLKGLLAIPDAIAGALSSVDAQLGRAMQELGLANKELVTSTLLPGLKDSIGSPLDKMAGAFTGGRVPPDELIAQFKRETVPDCTNPLKLQEKVDEITTFVNKYNGLFADLLQGLYHLVLYIPYLGVKVENDVKCMRQQANMTHPVELLGIADAVRALYRGIMSQQQAVEEAERQGIAPERFKVLQELQQFLPGPELALRMFQRGIITKDDYDAILTKQGFTGGDATALFDTSLEPVNPREVGVWAARKQAFDANFMPAAGAQPPPHEMSSAYVPRGVSPDVAKWDWLAHWKVPKTEWWFTAWARGLRTKEEFRLAAQQENIPPDVIDDLIPIFQETVQLWMIPDMLSTGIMTDAEALAYLHYIGLGDQDAALIMKYGKAKQKAPAAAQAATLAGISVSQAKTMYAEGIITADEYGQLLTAHGYGEEAVKLTIALADQEQQLAALKQQNTDIVNEVDAGSITAEQAVAAMYKDGYTTAQVDAVVRKFKTAKSAKAKAVSQSELDAMRVDGIIDVGIWKEGYANLGYAPLWIDRLDQLFLNKHPGGSDVPTVIPPSS